MKLLSRLNAHDLELKARALEAQIKRIDHRPRPTPPERELSAELKRLRLTVKDQLAAKPN